MKQPQDFAPLSEDRTFRRAERRILSFFVVWSVICFSAGYWAGTW